MLKNSIFNTLMISMILATSCSKQSPLVVKNEVAPRPEVYSSAMAINDLSALDDNNASEILSRISTNLTTDNDWSLFWRDLYVKYNSHTWSGVTLNRILDLSSISCGNKGSVSFSEFIQKILKRVDDDKKEEILIRGLNHFNICSLEINRNLVREFLSLYKKLEIKSSQSEFIKVFSILMNKPIAEDIDNISELIDSVVDVKQRLELYYKFKNNYHYNVIVNKVIDSFNYEEIIELTYSKKIEFDDALEILNISKHQQLRLSETQLKKLLKLINDQYQVESSKLGKYNISKFHYDTLRNLRYLSLAEVEQWASFALDNYKNIGQMYPRESSASFFLSSMNGVKRENYLSNSDDKIDQLLIQRAKLQTERNIELNIVQYNSLCSLYNEFGVSLASVNKVVDLNKLGCKNYNAEEMLEINDEVTMPVFSALNTLGADVKFNVKAKRLSVINTSSIYKVEKVKSVQVEDKYRHIVVPIVFAFSPLKDVGRFKVGQKQYLAIHHIFRDAREYRPGLEGVLRPQDGKKAGDIIFVRNSVTAVKHIALGGVGQEASDAKKGVSPYLSELNENDIESWVESFAGGSNLYFSDYLKNLRNLEKIIEASMDENENLNLYIDLDYINALSDEQRETLQKNLDEIKKIDGMGNVSDSLVLEKLVKRSTHQLIDTLKLLHYSDSIKEALPSIFTSIELGEGQDGERYENGKRGQNGQIIIE